MKRNLIVTAALAALLAGCGPTGKGNHTAAKPQSLASSTALSESTAASNSSADQASASASQNTSAPTPADESVEVGKEPVPAAIDYLTNNSAAKAALTDIPQDPSAYTVYDLSSKASITPKMTGVHAVMAPCSYARSDQTVATLPQSEAFVQAGAAGKSVVEFDRRGKAAKATLVLVDTVREAAGFPKE